MSSRLDPELLALPLDGRQLSGATLAEQLGRGPQLVVFLRHFG